MRTHEPGGGTPLEPEARPRTPARCLTESRVLRNGEEQRRRQRPDDCAAQPRSRPARADRSACASSLVYYVAGRCLASACPIYDEPIATLCQPAGGVQLLRASAREVRWKSTRVVVGMGLARLEAVQDPARRTPLRSCHPRALMSANLDMSCSGYGQPAATGNPAIVLLARLSQLRLREVRPRLRRTKSLEHRAPSSVARVQDAALVPRRSRRSTPPP